MNVEFNGTITQNLSWPDFEKYIDGTYKRIALQYDEDSLRYQIFAIDDQIIYITEIFKSGQEPSGWSAGQISDNTTYRTDFTTNYQPNANKSIGHQGTGNTPTGDYIDVVGGIDPNSKVRQSRVDLDSGFHVTASDIMADAKRRIKVVEPHVIFTNDQLYEKDTLFYNETTASGGTSTFVTNQANVALTLPTTSGASVIRQTRYYFPIQMGMSSTISLVAVMGTKKANVRQRVGYFDERNGIFYEQDGTNLKVVRRTYATGTAVDTAVSQSSWNIDKMDGTGVSALTFDPEKINTFMFDFSWPGRVRYGFLIQGKPYWVHHTDTTNTTTTSWASSASLPCRYEIVNTGTSASTTTLNHYGETIIADTDIDDFGAIISTNTGLTTKTVNSGTPATPVIAVRLRSTHNRGIIIPKAFDILATSTNRHLCVEFYIGGTVTGGAWSAITGSACEANLTATTFSGGTEVFSAYATSLTQHRYGEITSRLWAAASMDGSATEPITMLVGANGGTCPVVASLTWQEIL